MVDDDNLIQLQETTEISEIVKVESEYEETYFQLSPQAVSGHFPPNYKF